MGVIMNDKLSFVLFAIVGLCFLMCTSGTKISEQEEAFVIRTGVNVSHWLSQSDKRGEERRNYITKTDFKTIASEGFDHVRIPVDEIQLWDEEGKWEKEALDLLHNAINWALAYNLRVIVDLHIIRSHHFIAESRPLWTDKAEQEKLISLWRQLSGEMRKYPVNMVAYEILNEAVADDPEDWNSLVERVITEIRTNEPKRKVVVGSNRWQDASNFPDLRVPGNDKNIILSFHFYHPMVLTHYRAPWSAVGEYMGPVNYPGQVADSSFYKELSSGALEAMRDFADGYFTKDTLAEIISVAVKVAEEKNLSLYCGEFGVYPTIPQEISLRWYKDVCDIFNSENIAYCHWCYKGDFPILDEKGLPNRKLVDVLTSK